MEITIKATLLAKRSGIFTVYIFIDEDSKQYINCTRLPNWEMPDYKIGTSGYLTIEKAVAGEKYYDRKDEINKTYRFTQDYVKDFVPIVKQKEIIIL